MVNIIARPRKLPTKLVRLRVDKVDILKEKAKKKGMSLPDYLAWRLSR